MAARSDARVRMDRIDLKILACLHRDGRMTKARMGEEVGLSASRCWERVKRLERAGIIRGYHADIDLRRLAGLSLYQVHVRLANTTPAKAQLFERTVKFVDPVLSCHATLGGYDYNLIVAACDTETFQSIMDHILASSGVDFEFATSPIYRAIKVAPSSITMLVEEPPLLAS